MYEELMIKAATQEEALTRLVKVVRALRAPGGCPWDRAQTHETMIRPMVEEAYEVVEAIETGNMDNLNEELGDVLLQVVMHSHICEDEGLFDLKSVIENVSEKMIRRHPHVFAENLEIHRENTNMSIDNVLDLWENIKRTEKATTTVNAKMSEIPRALPALLRADKIQSKAAKAGFEWADITGALDKAEEELREVREAVQNNEGQERLKEEVGDLLFAAAKIARFLEIDPEDALNAASRKFQSRFAYVEETAIGQGKALNEMSLDQMMALWDEAKLNEKNK